MRPGVRNMRADTRTHYEPFIVPLLWLNLFEIFQQVRHFLRARLKLRHWWGSPACDLADQLEFGFALGHSVQVGPDLTVSSGYVTPGTVHLKDGRTLKLVASQGQDAFDVGVGDLKLTNCHIPQYDGKQQGDRKYGKSLDRVLNFIPGKLVIQRISI